MGNIEIINQQKVKKVNLKQLKGYARQTLKFLKAGPAVNISILLCDNYGIKKLNKKFLGKNSVTDVISFFLADDLAPDYLGDVAVSVEEAVLAAKKYGNPWNKELVLYVIHGILHLFGYDDSWPRKKKMDKKQQFLLNKLGI